MASFPVDKLGDTHRGGVGVGGGGVDADGGSLGGVVVRCSRLQLNLFELDPFSDQEADPTVVWEAGASPFRLTLAVPPAC